MRNPIVLLASLGCALGCGDNSRECGPGTLDEGGVCIVAPNCGAGTRRDDMSGNCVPDGTVVCTNGTVFDPLSGRCTLDPAACRDGTVLVNHACVDPTGALVIDVQEGPEPNGLGVVEASPAQAGNVTVPAAGTPFVVHGTLDPWRDADTDGNLDPDVDTYVLTVTRPTLLRITADGVHGALPGFAAIADVSTGPLVGWRRFGIRGIGDVAQRQVYLPAAGTYQLAIGDTRSLGEYLATGSATTAAGGDTAEYFVSITDVGSPTLAPLPGPTINGKVDDQALAFYQPAAGTGISIAQLAMPSELARASVVVMINGALRAFDDEDAMPARVMTGALTSGDTTFVVADYVVDNAPTSAPYTLSVTTTNL